MSAKRRYLLLQVRHQRDPMRAQEVRCFARALGCGLQQIEVLDLLRGAPTTRRLRQADIALLGGSGDYSVAEGGPWLAGALDTMRRLYELAKPTFASCWGFQAMSRALGGRVVTDVARAEVGSIPVRLTAAGRRDPVFSGLSPVFMAQMGHQDVVDQLPCGATLLASSDRVENQAFRFDGKPIYCTQFHPELDRQGLLERVRAYPWYVERVTDAPLAEFEAACREAPEAGTLLRRFLHHIFGD